ncbi:MAG: response regulator [Ginsengibacter sp.]|jgi:CheY-like chemotaxis protein
MRPIHILLVEDNEGDILLTKEAFENSNVSNQLSVVKDGQEAIYFLEKKGSYSNAGTPDFLLLDVNLPKRNGFEVLKFVKEDSNLKHIPVIMLSTSSSPKDINQSYSQYANCFITKPGSAEKLFDVISVVENFWVSVATLPVKTN